MGKNKKYYEDLAKEILFEGLKSTDLDDARLEIILERAILLSGYTYGYIGIVIDERLKTMSKEDTIKELKSIKDMVVILAGFGIKFKDMPDDPSLN
jgi:hypothetical protein